MLETIEASDVCQLKGSLFTLTLVQLLTVDREGLSKQLNHLRHQVPHFFQGTPVVLDMQKVSTESFDLKLVLSVLREHHLVPVGVRGGSEEQHGQARDLQLAIFNRSKAKTPAEISLSDGALLRVESKQQRTQLVTKPVRSGQQIYARGSDLIVTGTVSEGAELLADGNIHVYGSLRGRALAGVGGDDEARIFCRHLEAELLAIAGQYLLHDVLAERTQDKSAQAWQVFLQDEQLCIEAL